LVLAQTDELFDYHGLKLELLITNKFDVVPISNDYFLDYASADLSWYPLEDYRQSVDYITTEPIADFNENTGFLFEWNQPSQTSFLIKENSRLNAKNEFVRVTKKISFPIKDLDPAYSGYLQSQEIIDINDKIRQTASELVQGEDDLYSAVFRIAQWVEEDVDYDLSTLTAEATQKASWVIENRKGVCDEITSLFISMCRSLGIPARFVTGLSFSNINLQNSEWGPHGWAEVYFPSFGWIPFDVTYKEYGFVDATHIKLKTSLDAKETSIDYGTKGRNIEIEPGKLEFNVKVIDKDYKIKPIAGLEADVAERETGFGSYNLVILSVKNLQDYYVTTRISLANVNELKFLDNNFKSVLLKPKEEKKLYWMTKVSSELEPNYIYTFPIKIKTSTGEETETSFKASKQFKIYSEEYMRMSMSTEQPESKPYSRNVSVTCSQSKNRIYLNDSVNISCVVDNQGDQVLRNLEICIENDCSTTKVLGNETVRVGYTKKFSTLGMKTLVFKAGNELIEKSYYTIIEVQDKPLIEITNLSFPESMNYEGSSAIKLLAKKKSNTSPRNVHIIIEHELINEDWNVPSFDHDYDFTVLLKGESLKLNKNDFKIIITYEDEQGKQYNLEKKLSIQLNNPTLFQKIMIWLNIAEQEIKGWFNKV
jgi:hypothetical protein